LTFKNYYYIVCSRVILILVLLNMAVPKKRTSKAKRDARKANWKRKGFFAVRKCAKVAGARAADAGADDVSRAGRFWRNCSGYDWR
jgi:hypothetical protein